MYDLNLIEIFMISEKLIFFKMILIDLIKIITLLVAIAYFTLAERKIMAAAQRRKGPDIIGLYGLLQPIADGLKLLSKELIILVLSLVSWIVISMGLIFDNSLYITEKYWDNLWIEIQSSANYVIPVFYLNEIGNFSNFSNNVALINYTVLFLLVISSLNVYGIIIAGWASNSKYAFLGSLRSAAQMISYEVSIGLVILPVILLTGTLNFTKIIFEQEQQWLIAPLLPCAIIFFVAMLAETNRTPFDLTEAEAELVAGYNTEYSSIIFAMFFLAEYGNMILMSTIFTALFLGGETPFLQIFYFFPTFLNFSIKIVIFCFLFVIVRATFPRYRYDQLMNIGWKIFLPISLSYLLFICGLLTICNALPFTMEVI